MVSWVLTRAVQSNKMTTLTCMQLRWLAKAYINSLLTSNPTILFFLLIDNSISFTIWGVVHLESKDFADNLSFFFLFSFSHLKCGSFGIQVAQYYFGFLKWWKVSHNCHHIIYDIWWDRSHKEATRTLLLSWLCGDWANTTFFFFFLIWCRQWNW